MHGIIDVYYEDNCVVFDVCMKTTECKKCTTLDA